APRIQRNRTTAHCNLPLMTQQGAYHMSMTQIIRHRNLLICPKMRLASRLITNRWKCVMMCSYTVRLHFKTLSRSLGTSMPYYMQPAPQRIPTGSSASQMWHQMIHLQNWLTVYYEQDIVMVMNRKYCWNPIVLKHTTSGHPNLVILSKKAIG